MVIQLLPVLRMPQMHCWQSRSMWHLICLWMYRLDEIVKKIDTYLNEKQFLDNALILVDMGSLELIGNKIRNRYDINIGIINNTTTSMALHIGYGILQKRNIQEILQEEAEKDTGKSSMRDLTVV